MTKSSVGAKRSDPYESFNFCVKWDGRVVAGFSEVSGLDRPVDAATYRDGSDATASRKSPGRSKFAAITLKRGVAHDSEFVKWASKAGNCGYAPGATAAPKVFRKDLVIEIFNEAGRLLRAYKVFRCCISEFQALPDFDAKTTVAVAIQTLKLENQGWERDRDVVEPGEI